MRTEPALRYEQVARLVERQIASGTLRVNDRIPSVRSMSRTAGVSVSTVVQAYMSLENAGLIESRPQSGFYVRSRTEGRLPVPRSRTLVSRRPRSIATEALDTCREAMLRTDIVPLNSAISSPELYPNRRLNNLLREVLRDHPNHAGQVLLPPGDHELRRQIARRQGLAGAATDPGEVVITSGTMDAITLALRVLCRPGDTVLVESPTYFGVLQTIEQLDLKVVEVPNDPQSGIDVDGLRRLTQTTPLAAAVLMPNFSNPAGSLTPEAAKREIVSLLTAASVPVVEDDIYGDLHFGGTRPAPLRAYDDSGLVITCGSVSKTIALGYRIGWAVSSQYQLELQRAKFFSSVAAPTLQQHVLARYFASGGYDRHLRRLRHTLARNVQSFLDSIATHFPAGTRLARPAGGLVLWVELPENVDGVQLFREALASRVGVTPGIVFSAKADYRNFIRLNCGLTWTPEVEQALEKLGRLVSSMAHQSE